MNFIPRGWRIALTSSYPMGVIVPNQLTCVSKHGATFTCIRHNNGEYTEWLVEAPAPHYTPNVDEIRGYARRRLLSETNKT